MTKVKARQNATPTHIITKVAAMISRVNPPTQREMAAKLGESSSTIRRLIRKVLNAFRWKKCKVRTISMAQVEKHHQPLFGLYRKFKNDQWKYVVKTDEAMCYLGGSYGRRRVYYFRQPQMNSGNVMYVKRDTFAPGFVVLAVVSSRGKTKLEKVVKVDSRYYVRRVLTPLLDDDVPRLFRGASSRNMFFHKDSAVSHTCQKYPEFSGWPNY